MLKKIDLFSKTKIKQKDINQIFYELNIMLQANIVISDAFDILVKNRKDKTIKLFLIDLKKSFISVSTVSVVLIKYDMNSLVVSFIQICQTNGNVKLNISALNSLLQDTQKLKEEFKNAISYPIVLLISLCISINMIFYFVVPKFKSMFSQSMDSLPFATKSLFYIYEIYINYFFFILFFLLIGALSIYFYFKKNKEFQYFIDKLIIHNIPFFKDIYLSMQLYKLFLVLDIMIKSKYEFTKALESSKILLKNQYLLDRISLIENLLKNGKSISFSFQQTTLFDDLILNLINTAETSNSLDVILQEIKVIYKNRFTEKIKILTLYIEPVFLVTIVGFILWIVLAIFIPIWDMGNMIKI